MLIVLANDDGRRRSIGVIKYQRLLIL